MSIKFEWTQEMSVGNEVIDGQHQRLLAQINKILGEIVGGDLHSEVDDALHFLDGYIRDHFSYEEEYMTKINYPHLEEHKVKHHEFIKKYYEFKEEYSKGASKDRLISDIESYIGEWWVNHIGKEDKKYELFLEQEMKTIK